MQPDAADVLQVHEIGASCVAGTPGVSTTLALATQLATPEAFMTAVMTPFVTLIESAYLPMPEPIAAGMADVPLDAPVYVPLTW